MGRRPALSTPAATCRVRTGSVHLGWSDHWRSPLRATCPWRFLRGCGHCGERSVHPGPVDEDDDLDPSCRGPLERDQSADPTCRCAPRSERLVLRPPADLVAAAIGGVDHAGSVGRSTLQPTCAHASKHRILLSLSAFGPGRGRRAVRCHADPGVPLSGSRHGRRRRRHRPSGGSCILEVAGLHVRLEREAELGPATRRARGPDPAPHRLDEMAADE